MKELVQRIEDNLKEKVNLTFTPTPVHRLENLERYFSINEKKSPKIFIKREDLTGLALGGNKARILEYIFYDAIQKNSDCIILQGTYLSNCARQAAAACRKLNLECYLVLHNSSKFNLSSKKEGNLLLNDLLDAKILFIDNFLDVPLQIELLIQKLKGEGKNPYYIENSGANFLGYHAYINTMKEILEDERKLGIKFDKIILATGSFTTIIGLTIGNKIYNNNRAQIVGVATRKNENADNYVYNELKIFFEKLDNVIEEPMNMKLDQRFCEAGYANFSPDDKESIDLFALKEGIFLDPVYSCRAGLGLIKMIESNEIDENSNVLFLHTGGSPLLFSSVMKYN